MSAVDPCLSCCPGRKKGVVHMLQNPEMSFQRVSHGIVKDENPVYAPVVAGETDEVQAGDEMEAETAAAVEWMVGGRVLEVNKRL